MDVTKKPKRLHRLPSSGEPRPPAKMSAQLEGMLGAQRALGVATAQAAGLYVTQSDDVPIEAKSALVSGAGADGGMSPLQVRLNANNVAGAVRSAMQRDAESRVAALLAPQVPPDTDWLLAAHLAKFMDNVLQPGVSVREIALAFASAHPGVAERFPNLPDRIEDLQRRFKFMPEWRVSPGPTMAVGKRSDWDVVLGGAPAAMQLEKMLTLLSEVPLTMPLTEKLAARLADKQPFAKHNVVMVQHMLGQANPLVDAMRRCGMDPKNAEYVGVPYQQNPAVKATLENAHGLKVTVPEQGNIENMYEVICAAVDRAYERHLQNGEPILILDDGGYASKYIAQKYRDQAHLFTCVEQTTRGLTEIAAIGDVPHAVANVGGSYGKRFESAQVGDAVKMSIRGILDMLATTPTRKDVLIVGAGKVGEGVADSFAGDGARITIFDPYITPARKKILEKKGYTILTDREKALDKKFLVVGCSGHRSINMEDFYKMSSPVFVASASSKKVEVDAKGLEGETLLKVRATKINEQETSFHFLKDGRVVVAMADLLPVNFQRVNSIAPELIDHTMALMLLGAAEAVEQRGKKKGLFDISSSLQFWLQADMEGIKEGHSDDPRHINVTTGPFSFTAPREDWLKIATSPATPPEVLHELVRHFLRADEPMDSILLAICSARHELDDETVDMLLEYRCIPHMGRLLQNELLSDEQEGKIVAWLVDAYDAAANMREGPDVVRNQAVAARGNDEDGWAFYWPDIIDVSGRRALAYRVTTVRDHIVEQLGEALFAHPAFPPEWRRGLLQDTYRIAARPSVSAVLSLKNPAWTADELLTMLPTLENIVSSNARERKAIPLNYAYDIAEALCDHPSATPELLNRAEGLMKWVRQEAKAANVRVRGSEYWFPDPALGVALPDYGQKLF